MRFMKGKEYSTDLTKLARMLKKRGVPYKLQEHPVYKLEGKACEKLIGYCPAGRWQIIVYKRHLAFGIPSRKQLSVIRGMVSFGDIEMMRIGGKGNFNDPERFETEKEALEAIAKEVNK